MNQHFNWYSRYTDLKRVEFNKLEVQQKFTCSKLYWSFDNKNGTIIHLELVVFLKGLLKLYLH